MISKVYSPAFYLILWMLLLANVPQSHAQQASVSPQEGDTLDNVTISEAEARNIMKGLFDLPRLTHSLALGRIAKDERLTAFTDGFMQRNNIQVLTIGYIDSDEFWPRIFRQQRLNKINKADNDNLLAAKIIFVPVATEGPPTGYTTRLELTGKTSTVYELLSISQAEVDSIAASTSQQQLGNTTFATPNEAKETVVSALIAALQRVEESSQEEKDAMAADASLEGIQKIIIRETLEAAKANVEELQTIGSLDPVNLNTFKYECFAGKEESYEILLDNTVRLLNDVDGLMSKIDADESSPTVLRTASLSRLGMPAPHFDQLTDGIQKLLVEMFCEYMTEGIQTPVAEESYIAYVEDNYFLVAPQKKEFNNADTIIVHEYLTGFTIFLKDPDGKVVELDTLNFQGLKGKRLSSGFALDIEDIQKQVTKEFSIVIDGLEPIQLFLYKKVVYQDITGDELTEYEEDANNGVDDGESWNPAGYACNNAVRAFVYYHNMDAVLFPETMPGQPDDFRYGSGLSGPDDPTVLKGEISWDGTADNIWADFQQPSDDLFDTFTEVSKHSSETWNNFFNRLQYEANKGSVVVGVVHSSNRTASRGHIVAVVPKSLCSNDQRTLTDWKGEKKVLLPCAIEAGGNMKEIAWFKQAQSEVDKYKWYKYEN
ncbi:hypothetical protein [uncultured Imperialibacter sp.]|uniref:hypothetical protein n=1 Tax=uncultured Imperialibacter sp. TaxID=1672639 RepID=UPI0030D90B69|tara:strand:+ start:66103 stop:68073 length:1971 start_codon:yes stop_codon:yes gene_type:complete